MQNQQALITSMILESWFGQVKRTSDLIHALTDEQLMQEAAPTRNRGIYLLGHLTAVHDRMLPLLDLGEQLYPALDAPFLNNADKTVTGLPATGELRRYWTEVNAELAKQFSSLQPDEWLHRHTAVSPEAFVKEPHRNRLNVLLSRTSHLAYHFGQLAFLKP